MPLSRLLPCCLAVVCLGWPLLAPAQAADYRIDWHLRLVAGVDRAEVLLTLEDGAPVEEVSFGFDPERFSDFSGNGDLQVTANSVRWEPPARGAQLRYAVRISRARPNRNQDESYDALMTDDWALFRGDRVTPRARAVTRNGAQAQARMHLELPADWEVFTGWPEITTDGSAHTFALEDPLRDFDRPRGWIMAGKVVSRSAQLGSTAFSIVGPRNSGIDRMGTLALARLVWPELERAFGRMPPRILMVSANDPLWRGGLSGPNSFFFHASRRTISQNGTSPLFHELVHVISRIHGADRDDWIAEGLAEYYGIELPYRAGAWDEATRAAIYADLAEWAEDAPELRVDQSTGAVTARAVLVFDALDREIRSLSAGKASLDDVTRQLMTRRWVSLDDLRAAALAATGQPSRVLAHLE